MKNWHKKQLPKRKKWLLSKTISNYFALLRPSVIELTLDTFIIRTKTVFSNKRMSKRENKN
jgi:hypothetical protein